MSCRLLLIATILAAPASVVAQTPAAPTPYPKAPVEAYLEPTAATEIELARSAAPASISGKATVLVLGRHGYETAVTGTNGFTCMVARGWGNNFEHAEFWSHKARAPICYNEPSTRTVLSTYLERTRWVMEGKTKEEIRDLTRAAVASDKFTAPAPGSMCYMMSPKGYLDDDAAGPWKPHLMYFLPRTDPAQWGANVEGSPMIGFTDAIEDISVFLAPVQKWSDGTPGIKVADSDHKHN